MEFIDNDTILKFSVKMALKTPLMLRSGNSGTFSDSELERTPDGTRLHVNGYVWASLMKRALSRIESDNLQVKALAESIGDYLPSPDGRGISPVWFAPAFAPILNTEIRPGIRLDRKYLTTVKGALYTDEVLSVGHEITLNFNCYCRNETSSGCRRDESLPNKLRETHLTPPAETTEVQNLKTAILDALVLIDQGLERIGGGWSYGLGRLKVLEVHCCRLDLKIPQDCDDALREKIKANRKRIKSFDTKADGWSLLSWETHKNHTQKRVESGLIQLKPCRRWRVEANILDGQLMGIGASSVPIQYKNEDGDLPFNEIPDSFLFMTVQMPRDAMDASNGKAVLTVPGKALRQALFSAPIERALRSKGMPEDEDEKQERAIEIEEQMIRWFGSTDQRGILAIDDATISDGQTELIHRIQLCEHSHQNNNLFSGHYLKSGRFTFEILMDPMKNDPVDEELAKMIDTILEEMKGESAPPGWSRIGRTSTCTGQIQVTQVKPHAAIAPFTKDVGEPAHAQAQK